MLQQDKAPVILTVTSRESGACSPLGSAARLASLRLGASIGTTRRRAPAVAAPAAAAGVAVPTAT